MKEIVMHGVITPPPNQEGLAYVNGDLLPLAPPGLSLLKLMCQNRGKLVRYFQFQRYCLPEATDRGATQRVVDAVVFDLRQRICRLPNIESSIITPITHQGYALCDPSDAITIRYSTASNT